MKLKQISGSLALAGLVAAIACTKQQVVNGVNTGIQVAVDVCELAPQLLPPNTPEGTVVSLLCPEVENSATKIEVLIDQLVWNAMVKAYQTSHPGFVPHQATDAEVTAYRQTH